MPAAPTPTTLLCSYDEVVRALVAELDATGPGDGARLQLYLLEPGRSSEAVLEAVARAAGRGAAVRLDVDRSVASRMCRLWERTGTLLPRALELARRHPGRVVTRAGRRPDHSKYAVFRRSRAPWTGLLGGINLGDRFRPWRDFALRVEGQAVVAALERAVAGAHAPPDLAAPPASGVTFVANAPAAARYDVATTWEALAGRAELTHLRVAMAYLDRTGAAVLARALARGAAIELLLPRQANVYQHANMLAIERLLGAGGRLRVALHPEMVHAKALLAGDAAGPRLAFLGSANLTRNSLRVLGELNALVSEPGALAALDSALAALWGEAEPATCPRPFSRVAARIEERFG